MQTSAKTAPETLKPETATGSLKKTRICLDVEIGVGTVAM